MSIKTNLKYALFGALCIILMASCQSAKRFSKNQISLINQAQRDIPMRVLKITNTKDSLLLRTKSVPVKVDSTNQVLITFIDRLYATVRDSMSLGVGIAAPQVGILKNIILVQRLDKENIPFEVYLNPEIIAYSQDKQPCLEGCLSIPNRRDTTLTRSQSILIAYDRLDHTRVKENVKGFTAVIFQHEIDHLNGILYLDHLKQEQNQSIQSNK
tara:strand:+ start:174 stop:812 length:639 start_codon:yes stop_codon:yes gene_type:complete